MMKNNHINVMIAAVYKAASLIKKEQECLKKIRIYKKELHDIVTETDKKAENIIIKHLQVEYPSYDFLTEEQGSIIINNKPSEFRWIIDPIDGTFNYIHGNPNFAISLALERRIGSVGVIIGAVIHLPLLNETFFAEQGKGAYQINLDNKKVKIKVSNRQKFEHLLIAFNFYSCIFATSSMKKILNTIINNNYQVRISGSTVIDLAHIACGKCDLLIHDDLKPWDIAAGILLIQEAGGIVTDLKGKPASLKSPSIIATNLRLINRIFR